MVNNKNFEYEINSLLNSLNSLRRYWINRSLYLNEAIITSQELKEKILLMDILSPTQHTKMNSVNIISKPNNDYIFNEYYFDVTKSILSDIKFKYIDSKNNKQSQEMLKILLARNLNRNFEFGLAKIITGINDNYPFSKDLLSIQTFFYNLGYQKYI